MDNEASRGYIRAAYALSSAAAVALGCGAKSLEFFAPGSGGSSGVAGSDTGAGGACAVTSAQALDFLQAQCAQCHSGPQSSAFDFVLDVDSLTTRTSTHFVEPTTMMPARYIVPGDPQRSLLYQRTVDRSMPPAPDVGSAMRAPLPTPSEFSLLQFWISSCLGPSPVASRDAGGSAGMDGSSTGGACEMPIADSSSARPSDVLWPNDDACQGDQLPMVGSWDGYVENIVFPSGSDAMHMVIRSANATRVCGSVVFGALTAPPIVDATKGYPPGVSACDALDGGGATYVVRTVDRFDSFAMTMLDGRSSGARLQFRSTIEELWKPWCDVQRSYPLAGAPGGYSCVAPADCAPLADCSARTLCDPTSYNGSPCRCVSNGCTADPNNASNLAGQLTFDLRVVGDSADGSVDTGAMGIRNVHLTRTP